MKNLLLGLSFLSLGGCASQTGNLIGSLNSEPVCCNAYSEMQFDALPLNDVTTIEIGPGDKAFRFDEGKSYFQAYSLPDRQGAYSVEVTTLLIGQWIDTAHVFYPYLTFLDKDKNITRKNEKPRLNYDEGMMEGARWTGSVDLKDSDRYLIVHTSPEIFNRKIPIGYNSGGYAYSTGTGTVFVPPPGIHSSSFGAAGKLRIKFVKGVD